MQEQTNVRYELEQTQLNTIEHKLNLLIEHRANIMDVLTLEDFSSKAILTTELLDEEILGLFPQVKECVIEQRTLEADYRQLLVDYEAGLTDLIDRFRDLKNRIESEQARRQQVEGDDNRDDMLREYWAEFREYCNNHGLSLERVTWNRHPQYEGFCISLRSVSDRNIWLATWRNPNNSCIAVNLSLRRGESHSEDAFDALATFNALEEEKEGIEDAFGESLTWQREPSFASPGPVVGVYEDITPDRVDWQRQFEWLFTNLERLNRTFRPFIREILSRTN